jgi:HEAT repeat protein
MSRRRQIILVGILVVIVGGMALYFLQPREPRFQGKALSTWLKDFDRWDGDTNAPVVQAMRAMGTNAVPILANMCLANDSRLKQKTSMEFEKHPKLMKYRFTTAPERWARAGQALGVMGESARGACPIFLEALMNNDAFHRRAALNGFASLGPQAEDCLPAIIGLEHDADRGVRYNLMVALGRIARRPDLCVPVLLRGLESADSGTREFAAQSLGAFGTEAKAAVPALAKAAADTNRITARHAAASLNRIQGDE